ncbi:MAG: hypothetical protein GT597_08385 [Bacteroidales bacterium]|jgi:hypothetical protein|nr:hypothetical protein [Bacteroidales bacterium]
MKKIDVIVIILLSLLAICFFCGLIIESCTKIDYILLITLPAGELINSVAVAGNRGK